jgi:hypothetical protein
MRGLQAPRLFAPPPDENDPRESAKCIGVWRFPAWFVVQETGGSGDRERSRRLIHRKALDDKGRFDGRPVVATRFVRACPKGHVDDLDWQRYVSRFRRCVPAAVMARRTRHERRPGRRRYLSRHSALAGTKHGGGLQTSEPFADSHRFQCIFPTSGERLYRTVGAQLRQ